MKEVKESLDEVKGVPAEYFTTVVSEMLETLFTKFKDKEIGLAGDLLVFLVANGSMTGAHIEAGMAKFCETLEDFIVDAPKAGNWFSDIIAKLAVAGTITLKFFATVQGETWGEGWKLEEFFGGTTKFVIQVLGKIQAGSSAAKMNELLAGMNIDLRAKADDGEGKELPALLAEAKIELP